MEGLLTTQLHLVSTKTLGAILTNIRQFFHFAHSANTKRVLQDWQSFTFNIKFDSYFFWDCSRGNLGRKSNKKQFPWWSRSYYGRTWLHYENFIELMYHQRYCHWPLATVFTFSFLWIWRGLNQIRHKNSFHDQYFGWALDCCRPCRHKGE